MMTPISRRSFVSGATTLLLASPVAAEVQQPKRPWRIGMFNAVVRLPESVAGQEWSREELRSRGYVQGQNVVYEERWAEGHAERLPDLAADLVRLNVDVIVAVGTAQVLAARKVTTTIPIVVVSATLPVEMGLVASLAGRPQVFDDAWTKRLAISRRDFGTGMTSAEVTELTRQIDLSALREYRDAVGKRTREVV